MRFSDKNYPILSKISILGELCRFQEIGFSGKLKQSSNRREMLECIATHCMGVTQYLELDYVSDTFFDKVTNKKTFQKLNSIYCHIENCSGILLYPRKKFSTIHAISYDMATTPEKDVLLGEIHLYSKLGRLVVLYIKVEGDSIDWNALISDSVQMDSSGKPITKERLNDWFVNHIQTCLSVVTFKQFAEIETKYLGGKAYPKKIKTDTDKYLNESKVQINILDSRWFTETYRSEGFGVEGHFRLQPYGLGLKKRKLIYIKEYTKKGYNRKARLPNHNDETD